MRRTTLATVLLFAPVIPLIAQSPAPGRFEVASVKPDPKQDRGGPQKFGEFSMPPVRVLPGGSVESYGHTLRNLIAVAYGVNTVHQRIEGKQEILETEFNISAKAAVSSLSSEDALAMVRTLLEERFQLRWRLQPREVDGYVLMPARDDGRPGPGLRPFIGDCDERAKSNARVPFESAEYEELARCGWSGINSRQRAIGVSTKTIAERLTFFMATPVSDGTDWPGLFTFDIMADTRDLPYTARMPSPGPGLGAPRTVDAPYFLDALRSELGLKLVRDRATVNDFIIERLEPLIEN